MQAGRLGWTQTEFDYTEPRYFFNAMRGRKRSEMEQARLTAYYASLIHSSSGLKISDFGLFPWEDPQDFAPRFAPVDKEAFERIRAWEFPSDN